MEERKIGTGTSCILVKDASLSQGWSAPLYQWLKDEGYFVGTERDISWSGLDIHKPNLKSVCTRYARSRHNIGNLWSRRNP